jgi:hypothetical protein
VGGPPEAFEDKGWPPVHAQRHPRHDTLGKRNFVAPPHYDATTHLAMTNSDAVPLGIAAFNTP